MTLDRDQGVLLAAVAHRERTAVELAAAITAPLFDLERRLRSLRAAGYVSTRLDVCPLCGHASARYVFSVTERGERALDASPLIRRAAA